LANAALDVAEEDFSPDLNWSRRRPVDGFARRAVGVKSVTFLKSNRHVLTVKFQR
jgi:hypothetical protein